MKGSVSLKPEPVARVNKHGSVLKTNKDSTDKVRAPTTVQLLRVHAPCALVEPQLGPSVNKGIEHRAAIFNPVDLSDL